MNSVSVPPRPPENGLRYGQETNALAIVALVMAFVFAPAAIVCGHIARSQIRRTGARGAGIALAGLIIGYLSVAISVTVLVVIGTLVTKTNDAEERLGTTMPNVTTTPSAEQSTNRSVNPEERRQAAATLSGCTQASASDVTELEKWINSGYGLKDAYVVGRQGGVRYIGANIVNANSGERVATGLVWFFFNDTNILSHSRLSPDAAPYDGYPTTTPQGGWASATDEWGTAASNCATAAAQVN